MGVQMADGIQETGLGERLVDDLERSAGWAGPQRRRGRVFTDTPGDQDVATHHCHRKDRRTIRPFELDGIPGRVFRIETPDGRTDRSRSRQCHCGVGMVYDVDESPRTRKVQQFPPRHRPGQPADFNRPQLAGIRFIG